MKNKRIIGLLVGVSVLLCSVIFLTTMSSQPKENKESNASQIETNINNNDSESKETPEQKAEQTKDNNETQTSDSNTTKTETNNNKTNSTTSTKDNSTTNNNQSQSTPETNTPSTSESTSQYIYVSIDCKTILNNMNDLPEQYKQYVPGNGVILSSKKVKINDGDTVFDIITKVTKMNKISLTQSAGYIQSINNLPEKLFKGSGGWMYGVNGSYADKGSKDYKLKNNDKVQWRYTCYIGDLY
ncbi:MAG: DUF4430 domain-containing protein [Coprobacillus sp.]